MSALALTERISQRRELLMQRMDSIREREMAGDCPTAWFDIDAIEEEMEFLLDLQRTIHTATVGGQTEQAQD